MAELLHLDAAARLVGKSEVTLRRLVKAGKLASTRQKTTTGFIYLVDKADVLAFYGRQTPVHREPVHAPAAEEEEALPRSSEGKIRVGIADETGTTMSYWARRAETYEERYHTTLKQNAELREELGLWRGRAENSQALIMKLLPAPATVEVAQQQTPVAQVAKTHKLSTTGVAIITTATLLVIFGALYFFITLNHTW